MDPETARLMMTAVITLTSTTGIIGMLFRGNVIVLSRELKAANDASSQLLDQTKAHCEQRCGDLQAANTKLDDAVDELGRELKEQYRVNAEMAKQVFDTTSWLRSLAGLAQNDRRREQR